MSGAHRASADAFRPDLEGLRGVAIVLILLFHARIPFATGGYVGVDVFFVLSGFLITGILLREHARSGRVDLRAFYARRARRILPAAAVVLVLTLAASAAILAPVDLTQVAGDAVAVALSVGNMRFADTATDYFASGLAPSPFLHYWSLGVEEQFYLLWPALLILVALRRRPRIGVGVALGVVFVASLVAAIWLTDVSAPWAFFSLPTRAWQLALGGLLAVWAGRTERMPDRFVVPIGWVGLAAIVASLFLLDESTPYPGVAALLPTLGAAAIVLAGARSGSPGGLLSNRPLRFLGLISFSLYLVHWPILVLPTANLGIDEELPLVVRIGLVFVAIAAAVVLHRVVEEPIHRGRRFALPAGRTLRLAGVTIAATALIAVGFGAWSTNQLGPDDSGPVAAGADEGLGTLPPLDAAGEETAGPPDATDDPDALPSDGTETDEPAIVAPEDGDTPTEGPDATDDPTVSSSPEGSAASNVPGSPAKATSRPSPVVRPGGPEPLPAGVRPSVGRARFDLDLLQRNGCHISRTAVRPPNCVFGDPKGAITIALVGDSHAAQWFPAVQRIAVSRGYRLVTFTKSSCRFVDIPLYSISLKRAYTECTTWRGLVVQRLRDIRPDLTIVASAHDPETQSGALRRQGDAMARLMRQIPGKLAVMVDTPVSAVDVPSCLARHRDDVRPCETRRTQAINSRANLVERTAAQGSGAKLVDLTSRIICPDRMCPVVVNGFIVYRDGNHLTATFSASLAAALERVLPRLK